MQINRRRKAIAFFIVLGCALVAIALALNITWIVRWREVAPVVVGGVLFSLIIAGLVVNTVFVVREIRRNEQYDSFINAVTHELKTPIASIRLYLETLRARELTEAQRQDFYRIMHLDTDRLMSTVEQVLRAGETAQKRRARHWSPVDMAALLHECVELARVRHQLRAGALTEKRPSVAKELTTVLGDPDELRTAIANLLDNAVKYSREQAQVCAEVLVADKQVSVRVSDRGMGIPRGDLKHIFKRFFRAGTARTKVKGTGLGLFIVRAIVKHHRGSVSAESEGEGKGATITLRLPRLESR